MGGKWWHIVKQSESEKQYTIKLSTFRLIRRMVPYASAFKWQILLLVICIAIQSALGLLPPLISKKLIDEVLVNGDRTGLNLLGAAMLGIPLVNSLLKIINAWFSNKVGTGITSNLRKRLFAHLQQMSLRFYTNTKTGELMSRLNNDVPGAQKAVTGTFIDIVSNITTLVIALVVMFSMEWRLTLLAVGIFPLFLFPATKLGNSLRVITADNLDAYAKMNAIISEMLSLNGVLLVKLFGRQTDNRRKYEATVDQVAETTLKNNVVGVIFVTVIGIVSAVGTGLVYWIGGGLVLSGSISLGTIIAFSAYLKTVYDPISTLVNSRVDFVRAVVSFERVFEVIDLPVEVKNPEDAILLDYMEGDIKFQSVSFGYGMIPDGIRTGLEEQKRYGQQAKTGDWRSGMDPKYDLSFGLEDEYAVRDVTFHIKPGQMCALVGRSGAGKSTLSMLLPRLYDTTDGRILIDDRDIRDIDLDNLAQHIGIVTQDTFLFHDTIGANLLFAKPNASDAEVEAACRVANIWDKITSLPEGLDTLVGERGFKLSGGEKQRISIARAILKDPRILILDEATSALDSESEQLIQGALEWILHGRSSLVIAHRLSTILKADLIVVMDKGRVVEIGVHDELLAKDGLYAHLYHTQFSSGTASHLLQTPPREDPSTASTSDNLVGVVTSSQIEPPPKRKEEVLVDLDGV